MNVFKLIEDNGLNLHGDIEHFAELVKAEAEKQEQKTPLKVLNLTVFTENRLRNGRVYDVETLQAMTNRDILAIPDMGKKALKEVLEALDAYAIDIPQKRVDETAKDRHEPVFTKNELIRMAKKAGLAWVEGLNGAGYGINKVEDLQNFAAIVAASREWVGLTDGDIAKTMHGSVEGSNMLPYQFARAIEAKLKEKNHG